MEGEGREGDVVVVVGVDWGCFVVVFGWEVGCGGGVVVGGRGGGEGRSSGGRGLGWGRVGSVGHCAHSPPLLKPVVVVFSLHLDRDSHLIIHPRLRGSRCAH